MPAFDFPSNPPPGTSATTPDGAVRYWDGQKWDAAYSGGGPPGARDASNDLSTAQNATIARTLANRFADRYSVEDWLTPGQPDGTTDNTAQLQAAIDAAAGVTDPSHRELAPGNAQLLVPANPHPYVIGSANGLQVPSNTHLLIEHGATLQVAAGVTASCLGIAPGASNILIELYGTLDGHATPSDTITFSAGIVTLAGPLYPGNCSNIQVVGGANQGRIINMRHWPINLTSCTNGEVNGVTMDGAGNAAQICGITPMIGSITSATYDTTTGNLVITTPTPHGLAVGALFTLTAVTGTGNSAALAGAYTALAGTGGTTILAITQPGFGTAALTGGTLRGPTAPSYDVGFVGCTVRNIPLDLGVVLYGGVYRGYVRDCDISACNGGGAMIFSDGPQSGQNHDCEITGNVLWNNNNFGAYVASNIAGIIHKDSVISNNRIFANNGCGIYIGSVDGVLIDGNYIHENIYKPNFIPPLGITGEITVLAGAARVSITNNVLFNPNVGCTDGNGYGIAFNTPNYMLISGNRIGDWRPAGSKTMTAALGGIWGQFGLSEGNYYGPRLNAATNFPSDISTYAFASQQGINYDMVTGFTSGMTLHLPIGTATSFPPLGLSVGWNRSGSHGEVDFLLGKGPAVPGGFDFLHVTGIYATTGTYNVSGAVSLTTNLAHSVVVGSTFTLAAVQGTDTVSGNDILKLNGPWVALAGTTGSTLLFTAPTSLTIATITAANVNSTPTDGGVIDVTKGLNGSLLANDGYGNTRLGGALVHGAAQAQTLANAGTLTINPNTSMVLVQNSGSIATGTIVLPTPAALGFASQNAELEINFQSAVGALTVVAGGTLTVSGAPTSIAAAGTSINFLQHGNAWLRRIMA